MKIKKERWGYSHYCPGCKLMHYISTEDPDGCNWSFDGPLDTPSFHPSVSHSQPWMPRGGVCHYFIRDGRIEYCSDSTHDLAGQTVDLPDIPEQADEA